MLDLILVALLALHLLLVDVAMAGPLVCVWLEWRGTRRADMAAGRMSVTLARWATVALALGILVGSLLLAIRWYLDDAIYFSALATIPRDRLWFALGELIFFFVCMGAYLGLHDRWRRRRLAHRVVAIAAASNLLLHFPALFAIVSVLTTRSDMLGQTLDRSDYQRMLLDGEVVSQVLHVWLAAFAVSGMAVMLLAQRAVDANEQDPSRIRLIKAGALLALVPTLLQIPAGLWVALEMPDAARDPLFGGDWVATGLFVASLLLAMQLMHSLAGIALGNCDARQVRGAIAIMTLVVLLMVGTRCRVQNSMMSMHGPDARPRAAGLAEVKSVFSLRSAALGVQ